MSNHQGWIGVDLDGTIVFHDSSDFHYAKIGKPIKPMCDRIRRWLKEGTEVRLMTARAGLPTEQLHEFIINWTVWSQLEFGQVLQVTDRKDFWMIELWDSRAVTVIPNTGLPHFLV